MAGVVDTSFLYALLVEADPRHVGAMKELARHSGLEIPPAIVAETEMLLRKRSGRGVAIATLEDLLAANPQVGILDADLHPTASRLWKAYGGISYADAHAVAGALLLGSDLVTFDEQQEAVWRKERKD